MSATFRAGRTRATSQRTVAMSPPPATRPTLRGRGCVSRRRGLQENGGHIRKAGCIGDSACVINGGGGRRAPVSATSPVCSTGASSQNTAAKASRRAGGRATWAKGLAAASERAISWMGWSGRAVSDRPPVADGQGVVGEVACVGDFACVGTNGDIGRLSCRGSDAPPALERGWKTRASACSPAPWHRNQTHSGRGKGHAMGRGPVATISAR